jgi:hypothetical protein
MPERPEAPDERAGAPRQQPVDPDAVRASYERLTALFTDMMSTVTELSTHRCPYKDATDHCTARFGCRNQRRPDVPDGLRVCGGDDRIDYRSAWESS